MEKDAEFTYKQHHWLFAALWASSSMSLQLGLIEHTNNRRYATFDIHVVQVRYRRNKY